MLSCFCLFTEALGDHGFERLGEEAAALLALLAELVEHGGDDAVHVLPRHVAVPQRHVSAGGRGVVQGGGELGLLDRGVVEHHLQPGEMI